LFLEHRRNTGINTGIPVLALLNTEIPVLQEASGIEIPKINVYHKL
jgi:hypothetical protein